MEHFAEFDSPFGPDLLLGHHLVTGAMLEGACPGYTRTGSLHKDAPTVCVEAYPLARLPG